MRPSTSWERQCRSRARRAEGLGRRELVSLRRCSSGPRKNARVGEERCACRARAEIEVHFFAWQLILSSYQKRRCWLVGEEEQYALDAACESRWKRCSPGRF